MRSKMIGDKIDMFQISQSTTDIIDTNFGRFPEPSWCFFVTTACVSLMVTVAIFKLSTKMDSTKFSNDIKSREKPKDLVQSKLDLQRVLEENKSLKAILEKFEKLMDSATEKNDCLAEEKLAVQNHLSHLERSFKELLEKYDRARQVIEGMERNEKKLKDQIVAYEQAFHRMDETFLVLTERPEGVTKRSQVKWRRSSLSMEKSKLGKDYNIDNGYKKFTGPSYSGKYLASLNKIR